jgi:hypothetical protein
MDVINLDHVEQLMVIPVVHTHPDDDGVDPHLGDFEWRNLLHTGRSGYRLGGTALNLGLQAATNMPLRPNRGEIALPMAELRCRVRLARLLEASRPHPPRHITLGYLERRILAP